MRIVWEVQNVIPALSHKTRVGCGVNALFAFGYEKIKLQKDIEYEIPE